MPVLAIVGVVMLFSGGALLMSAFLLSRRARLDLRRHVGLVAEPPSNRAGGITRFERAARAASVGETGRRLFCIGVSRRWGMRTGVLMLMCIGGVSAGIAWIVGYRLSGSTTWLAGLLAALAFLLAPRVVLVREQKRAERNFMELLPNAIDMIVRMLRAGLPISSATRSVGLEAPPPFNTVFALVADQVDIGVPFERALDRVSQKIGLADFRFFSVAVTLQHATGGNLTATLEILSDLIRKRRAVRLKGIAATAEVRLTAYVLAGLPIMTVGALLLISPDYVAPLLDDPRGNYILGTAVGLLALAFLTMRQMMRRVTAA